MSKIKICGLTRQEDIMTVNEYLPDYIGFIFAESRRQVTEEQAKLLKQLLSPWVKAVGVFVNDDIRRIAGLCSKGIIDLVQLHGDEDEGYIRCLRTMTDKVIIKAIRVKTSADVIQAFDSEADYLLFDTYHKQQYGGSGIAFDWSLIKKSVRKFFLAGGINEDNILEAVGNYQPYAVDVSSGVETDGKKDPQKIRNIIAKVRSVK
jgi:phosphoribosylanthranilate isomerase